MKISLLIGTLGAMALPLSAQDEWRSFTSADGIRSFEGRLMAYDAGREVATIKTRAGATVEVGLDRLAETDREQVREAGEKLPLSVPMDLRFTKVMELSGRERSQDERVKTYDGKYRISVRNFSTQMLRDVEIEYLVIYRQDSVDGLGERVMKRGSASLEALVPNMTDEFVTDGIEMTSLFKPGTGSLAVSGCGSCGTVGGSATATRSQRSRDTLLGCVVRVKVGENVVHTGASSVDILRKYGESFDETVD